MKGTAGWTLLVVLASLRCGRVVAAGEVPGATSTPIPSTTPAPTASAAANGMLWPAPEATPWRYRSIAAALIAAGCIGGASKNAFFDHSAGGFGLAHENWFGEHTYAGGADKVSHFVSFDLLAKELAYLYGFLGYDEDRARLLGFGVSLATGAIIEIGDGTNLFGFSYEDLLMDLAGAGTAVVLAKLNAEDVLGFRFGKVPGPAPEHVEDEVLGRDYDYEIYTADIHLAGVARRLGIDIGLARYLLVSATYGVKGYPRAAIPDRERQIGFEIGLNIGEMLNTVNVTRSKWWGFAAHVVADDFRIPYTAGGYRYDLNHARWRGPNTGEGCGACR